MAEKDNIPPFLRRNGDALLFNGEGELVFYVPEHYFSTNIAIVYGAYISMLGVCDYTIFDKTGKKNNGLHPFRFPTIFLCKPYTTEIIKGVKLTKDSEPSDYRLLRFKDGDEVVTSVKVPQVIDNVEMFFNMFLVSGKIPTTIPYDKIQEYIVENMNLNGSDYGVNMQLFGLVVSELCRDPKDLSRPFRLSNMDSMNGYKPISIKKIPDYVSPYVAITSENFDESLMAAILSEDDKYSPLEKVLTL